VPKDNPNIPPCGNYSVNVDPEDIVRIYVNKWVLMWCKKYHPEAFKEAEEFIRGILNESEESIEKNKTN
jgi:hypothetical protein